MSTSTHTEDSSEPIKYKWKIEVPKVDKNVVKSFLPFVQQILKNQEEKEKPKPPKPAGIQILFDSFDIV